MKTQEAYTVIFNELFDIASKLEEVIGYCEQDLSIAKQLKHKPDQAKYQEELIKTKERLERVYGALQFTISKIKV